MERTYRYCGGRQSKSINFISTRLIYNMSTYHNSLIHGGGIFMGEKYPGERHVHG